MSEEFRKNIQIAPCVIVPDRSFLIGAMYGLQAARKRIEDNPKPLFNNHEVGEQEQDFYTGSWLELHCAKCGAFFTFDDPEQLPQTNLICGLKGCDNHLIVYGVGDPKFWRIGEITFV